MSWPKRQRDVLGGINAISEESMALLERAAKIPAHDHFIDSLKVCRKNKDLARVKRVHSILAYNGLGNDVEIGNYLVPTLVECGGIHFAQRVFQTLEHRNIYSWTALVQAHNDLHDFDHAFSLLDKMRLDSVSPSCYTFQALVQSCTGLKSILKGREIHTEIIKEGYDGNDILITTLLDMYVKCGLIVEAKTVFEHLPDRNLVAWNTLIVGYAECGFGEEALECFEAMQLDGVQPDEITLVGCLKSCSNTTGRICIGRQVHSVLIKHGMEKNITIANTLVYMYTRLGFMMEAQAVFDKMLVRDNVSWNVLMTGFIGCEHDEKVLYCLEKMQLEGISPSRITIMNALSHCGCVGAINRGHELHAYVIKQGIEIDSHLGTSLVDMYSVLGFFPEAQNVFDEILEKNVFTWTALITGYAEHGFTSEALGSIEQMKRCRLYPDVVLLCCGLKCCSADRDIHDGLQMHSDASAKGLESDQLLAGALVSFYAKFGFLSEAQKLFDKLPSPNAFAWCALTAGYSEQGLQEETIINIEEMLMNPAFHSVATAICSLKACGNIAAIGSGCEIHALLVRQGHDEDPSVGLALLSMYVKSGLFLEAHGTFNRKQGQNLQWWNELIQGYSKHHYHENVLSCMEKMNVDGVSANDITYICGLKASSSLSLLGTTCELHAMIVKAGLESNHFVANTILDVLVKSGMLEEAWSIFSKLSNQDIVSWNIMMAGYAEHGRFDDVVRCFDQMGCTGVSSNSISFIYCLRMCSYMGAVDRGSQLHVDIIKKGFEQNTFITGCLVDMYARSGSLAEAWEIFYRFPSQNVVLWTALLAAYTYSGDEVFVFHLLQQMEKEGIEPNQITLLCVFTVCSHSGRVTEAQTCFVALCENYHAHVNVEHFNCMVDLHGRSGQHCAAVFLLENMPFHPDLIVWHAVMGASKKWNDLELAKIAFKCINGLGDRETGMYVVMHNVYADARTWERWRD